MRVKLLIGFVLLVTAACSQSGDADKSGDAALETDAQKLGYALGMQVGTSLQNFKGDMDIDAFAAGVRDQFEGSASKLAEADANQVRIAYFTKKREAEMAKRKEQGEANAKAGEAFLTENAKKTGVKETDSGLQYIVMREGKGAKPTADDVVTVNYRGTLIDGTEFDSSYARNQPVTFPLKGVIPGWTEALQLMSVGSLYKLYIPSKLAYGENGAGNKIGPNSTLVFEVELLSIGDKSAAAAPKEPNK